ncbi:MAG: hypothetical protein JXM70_12105 [Pirellulales bacterium]|nr:hypothetical protein [Pirellulales bacterium]
MYRRGFSKLLLSLTVFAVFGCSSGSSLDRAALTGTVTFDGKPLDRGMIGLLPTGDTRGPQGSAAIKSDGTYEVQTAGKPGTVIGTHKVVVQCRETISQQEARDMKVGRSLIPAKYTSYDTTPLTVEVTPGENVFDIKLEK